MHRCPVGGHPIPRAKHIDFQVRWQGAEQPLFGEEPLRRSTPVATDTRNVAADHIEMSALAKSAGGLVEDHGQGLGAEVKVCDYGEVEVGILGMPGRNVGLNWGDRSSLVLSGSGGLVKADT